jgi:CubicO group peptidase (beta-lactamase class C family)
MRDAMEKSLVLATIALALLLASCSTSRETSEMAAMQNEQLKRLSGESIPFEDLEAFIEQTMGKANVAGLSCVIINDSEVVYRGTFGYKDQLAGLTADEDTAFSAASLSKPVFAYLVMLLVDEDVIDLDRPLHEYLTDPLYTYPTYADLQGDERYELITARHALSHSTGFPNWRFLTQDQRLNIMFAPGERYSYSGEGINLLQMVVEEVTGKSLEDLAQEKVFGPLGMTRTSYVWREGYEDNAARPHDEYGRPRRLDMRGKPDAAGSMQTTAEDYARFLVGLLRAEGVTKAAVEEMLRPQMTISSDSMFGPGAWRDTGAYRDINLSWGLGWGRFDSEHGRAFFHHGHGFGSQNYTVTFVDAGIGIVLLSNSDNFESVAGEILESAIGDVYSPIDWVGYIPFDPSQKHEPPPEPVAIQVDPAALAAYRGTYKLSMGQRFYIKLDDGTLFLSGDGEHWEQLQAESETRFFFEDDDARYVFAKDEGNRVTALNVEIQGLKLSAEKID